MRGQFASMSRLLLFASIASLAVGVTAEPKYCGNGLWYPGGVCPSQPPPTPPPAPPPQGPSPEQKEQLLKEQLRQQQVRSEQLRHEAYTRAEEAGISAYRRGDYEAAVQYFERALEYDPYNLTIKHNIQRAREKLAEQNAPPPAHSSHAFDQLNAIANGDRAVVQAPRSSYSGNLGGTGAPYGARTGFDTVAPTTPIPFAFTKYLEPGTDPVIPPQRRTPAINALEKQRNSARVQAMNLEMRRIASSLRTATVEQKRQQPQIAQQEKAQLQKVQFLNFSISKELSKK